MAAFISESNNVDENNTWLRINSEMLSLANIEINGDRAFDIKVFNSNFFKRVLQQGSIGLGESYMDGWWDCERLDIFFHKVIRAGLESKIPRRVIDTLTVAASRLMNFQSIKRAKIVGEKHYDLGNDLFGYILDDHMQYSCGYWANANTLEQAQEAKLRLICEKLQLKPGMKLLDIGCGWGGLAAFAARHYGVSVVGITISKEQQKLAQERCKGLAVSILLRDYRHIKQNYDRIVSVGMFEHVGYKNYNTYFKLAANKLKPDGLFLLHTIGSNKTTMGTDPWITKYIFQNGSVPSMAQIAKYSEPYFVVEDVHNFGADYDKTLMEWDTRFKKAWPLLSDNYSERFYRMFTYYLNACAGAFRARDLQLWQVLFSPGGVEGGIRVAR